MRMCKAQVNAFNGRVGVYLKLINDEFTVVLADVGRESIGGDAPEEVLGD